MQLDHLHAPIFVLFCDLPQFLIQLCGPAAGIFDIDKGAVHDAHPVGINREQQLMLLGVIVIAHGDGIHRKFVGVGGIGFCTALAGCVCTGCTNRAEKNFTEKKFRKIFK